MRRLLGALFCDDNRLIGIAVKIVAGCVLPVTLFGYDAELYGVPDFSLLAATGPCNRVIKSSEKRERKVYRRAQRA